MKLNISTSDNSTYSLNINPNTQYRIILNFNNNSQILSNTFSFDYGKRYNITVGYSNSTSQTFQVNTNRPDYLTFTSENPFTLKTYNSSKN